MWCKQCEKYDDCVIRKSNKGGSVEGVFDCARAVPIKKSWSWRWKKYCLKTGFYYGNIVRKTRILHLCFWVADRLIAVGNWIKRRNWG